MFQIVREIMSPEKIKAEMPLSKSAAKKKVEFDKTVKAIISGEDKRKLMIIGPCSADNERAVLEYAQRLARLAEKVKDKFFMVPRVYTNKPRTRGEGYKGMLHSPDPNTHSTDIQAGILALRHMHIRVIEETGLFTADEMLYPDNYAYLDDILAYVAIGARSSENQQHRLVASGADVPVGVKNPMNGSLSVLINSIYAAQISNEFKYGSNQVKTSGNAYAHAVLRGSVNVYGKNLPNYHFEDIMSLAAMWKEQNLDNPGVVIDCNHSNSNKLPLEQVRIMREVIGNMKYNTEMRAFVKGFMVESYLLDGNQKPEDGVYGKSITDACLGWENTENLILHTADHLVL